MPSARNPLKQVEAPGSPVTPHIRDPARDSGLHLLCLAAGANVQGPLHPSSSHLIPPPRAPHRTFAFPAPSPPFALPALYGSATYLPTPPPHHVVTTSYLPYALAFHPGSPPSSFPLQHTPAYCARAARAPSAIPSSRLSPPTPAANTGVTARRVKGPWRPEEDALLTGLVARFGARRWTAIAAHIPGRTGKQARERWLNQLSPDLAKRAWSSSEDRIVMEAHARLGNRWSEIAKLLDGRTDNAVKNRFNTTIRRQISELSTANRTKTALETSDASSCEGEKMNRKRKVEVDEVQQPAAQRIKVLAISA